MPSAHLNICCSLTYFLLLLPISSPNFRCERTALFAAMASSCTQTTTPTKKDMANKLPQPDKMLIRLLFSHNPAYGHKSIIVSSTIFIYVYILEQSVCVCVCCCTAYEMHCAELDMIWFCLVFCLQFVPTILRLHLVAHRCPFALPSYVLSW